MVGARAAVRTGEGSEMTQYPQGLSIMSGEARMNPWVNGGRRTRRPRRRRVIHTGSQLSTEKHHLSTDVCLVVALLQESLGRSAAHGGLWMRRLTVI